MRYKNILNSIKEKIPYNMLQKALIQLAISIFCIALGYYGLNLVLTTEEKMSYSFDSLGAATDGDSIEGEEVIEDDEQKVNINTATKEELMTLPNIGAKKADEIINYRDDNEFLSIEDIMEVSGIGSKTFETLRALITI